MSHWLDDAARGLSEGTFTRRAVLRRGGAVAAGTLVGSLTLPGRTFAQALPCASNQNCPTGAECCKGRCCASAELCCDGACVPRAANDRCGDTCCNHDAGERCCDGRCCRGHCCDGRCCGEHELCCGGPGIRNCLAIQHTKRCDTHCCGDAQSCCGEDCCFRTEQCCHSGKLAYCAPKGHCCGKGKHRVACGSGKHLCCPEDEHCCGGKCCKPENCRDGVCGGPKCLCTPPLECCGPNTCISPPPHGAGCCIGGVTPGFLDGSTCCDSSKYNCGCPGGGCCIC